MYAGYTRAAAQMAKTAAAEAATRTTVAAAAAAAVATTAMVGAATAYAEVRQEGASKRRKLTAGDLLEICRRCSGCRMHILRKYASEELLGP